MVYVLLFISSFTIFICSYLEDKVIHLIIISKTDAIFLILYV